MTPREVFQMKFEQYRQAANAEVGFGIENNRKMAVALCEAMGKPVPALDTKNPPLFMQRMMGILQVAQQTLSLADFSRIAGPFAALTQQRKEALVSLQNECVSAANDVELSSEEDSEWCIIQRYPASQPASLQRAELGQWDLTNTTNLDVRVVEEKSKHGTDYVVEARTRPDDVKIIKFREGTPLGQFIEECERRGINPKDILPRAVLDQIAQTKNTKKQ